MVVVVVSIKSLKSTNCQYCTTANGNKGRTDVRRTVNVVCRSWTPQPRQRDNSRSQHGGRNTSPCIIFHPAVFGTSPATFCTRHTLISTILAHTLHVIIRNIRSCCSIQTERLHRSCHLSNNTEYHYHTMANSYTLHPACKKLSGGLLAWLSEWWGTGVVICLERGADLHMAQWMPLPLTVSCFSKIQIGFTFLVPVHPGSPERRAIKRVCVCYIRAKRCFPKMSVTSGIRAPI